MEDIQDKVFADFEVPTTCDGSYRGMKKIADATQKHFEMKLNQELDQINSRLKSGKTKVSLVSIGGGIQLRATLPLKPGDTHKQGRSRRQYTISLGIPANFDGLKTAEEEAYELGKLIARQTFTWTDKYLGVNTKRNQGITFREFYEMFEKLYFQNRKKTRKSIGTIQGHKKVYRQRFLSDLSITKNNFRELILKADTYSTRIKAISVASIVCNLLDISVDFSDLFLEKQVKQRYIPSDDEIQVYASQFKKHYESAKFIEQARKDRWKIYQFFYGLIAVYGLRPREIINDSNLYWLISPDNKNSTFKVGSDNKTGYREVFPFVPEWIELFELKNQSVFDWVKKDFFCDGDNEKQRRKIDLISRNFRIVGIPFTPYDLRHACAIRAHLQGIPIKAAADNLGHSVEMHTKVYQKWFGLENRRKAFNQAFEEISEVEQLKYKLRLATERITELELENSRLRLCIPFK
ncbi:phage integrase family protein [Rivularia sp. PCC 7116]|nr:phage integrase family protein [Rivularia sp. PCC 7116]